MGNLDTGATEKIATRPHRSNADMQYPEPNVGLFFNILSPFLQGKSVGVNAVPSSQDMKAISLKPLTGFSTEDWLKARNQAFEEKRQKSNSRLKLQRREGAIQ